MFWFNRLQRTFLVFGIQFHKYWQLLLPRRLFGPAVLAHLLMVHSLHIAISILTFALYYQINKKSETYLFINLVMYDHRLGR